MSAPIDGPFALWLAPAEEPRRELRRIIERLAGRFGAPAFEPHATLCSGESPMPSDDPGRALDELGRAFGPISLAVEGIGWTDDYFQFFFIKLADDGPRGIFRRAGSRIAGTHSPVVGPHLSLVYADRESIDRAALERELAPRLPARIAFDAIRLVMPSKDGWRDISRWEIRRSVSLSAA